MRIKVVCSQLISLQEIHVCRKSNFKAFLNCNKIKSEFLVENLQLHFFAPVFYLNLNMVKTCFVDLTNWFPSFNFFTAKVALMHPKKIVQSQLRHRLAKAASELGLHYFLFHLAKTHQFTNIVDLLYSFLSQIKYNIE